MRLICTNDWHLTNTTPVNRLDNIEETWKRKLTFMFNYAKEKEAIILVAGDVFDRPREWGVLAEIAKNFHIQHNTIIAVYGQHDTRLYSEETRDKTSLGIWSLTDYEVYIADTILSFEDIKIQGCSYGQQIPKPIKGKKNILLIHKMITDSPLYPGQEYTDAKKFLDENEFDLIVCGDAHRKFMRSNKGRYIVNAGPLLRLEASREMYLHKPGFWVCDTDKISIGWIDIPHEPAEKVLTRESIESKAQINEMLNGFIEGCSNETEINFSFEENLQNFIEKNEVSKEVVDIISNTMMEVK